MNADEPQFELSAKLGRLRFPLMQGARDALEASISEHGVVTPLVVAHIAGDNVLLDGHTRAEICKKLGIVPPITVRDVEDEEQLEVLFVQLQLARRSLPEIGEAYLRGVLYLQRKRQGCRSTSCQSGEKSSAEVLAAEFGTSPRTIQRDAKLVRAMETIETILGEKARNALCSGEIKATRREIEQLSKMNEEDMNAGLERLRLGEPLATRAHSPHRTASALPNTGLGAVPRSSSPRLLPPPAAELSHHEAVGDDVSPSEGDRDDQDDDQDQGDGPAPLASADLTPVTAADGTKGEDDAVSIFEDVPELTAAHEGLGLAKVSLERLREGWESGPGRDVDGVVERLEKAIELVSEAHAIVDLGLIPREHCRGCAGEDCDTCGGFGWFSKADLQANAE